jgi:Asp-tRNA(Asn)/Glu-tRNA(Gln) amidotransferase A subunit family amidase
MARTVKDAALILTIIVGKDLHDPRTAKIPFDDVPNYVNSCQISDLKTFRIGVPRNGIIGVGDAIMESFEHALTQLKTAGAAIVETRCRPAPCAKYKGKDNFPAN